jgi:hypothetical protein
MTIESDFGQRCLRNPKSAFAEPNDVVLHPELSWEMKLAILREWEQDARRLSVSESEGMSGGEENMLGRVEAAIETLIREKT